jgi:xylulokinase
MPEIKDGYESRGNITPAAAAYFQLPVGIPVSVGWSDAMSGMVAMGVMNEPTSFIITGTSAIVGASSRTPPKDGGGLYVIPNTCSPLSVTYGPTQSSGSAIEWAAKALGLDSSAFVDLAGTSSSQELPIFLPYIDGERAPIWRPDIRAGFYGLSSTSKREDLAAAVMEGIGFAERQVVEIAEGLNGSRAEVVKLGGHAGNDGRGEAFRLRTLGRAIERFVDTDTTTRGAAILAHAILSKNLGQSTEKLAFSPIRKLPSDLEIQYAIAKNALFLLAQRQAIELADSKIK